MYCKTKRIKIMRYKGELLYTYGENLTKAKALTYKGHRRKHYKMHRFL